MHKLTKGSIFRVVNEPNLTYPKLTYLNLLL